MSDESGEAGHDRPSVLRTRPSGVRSCGAAEQVSAETSGCLLGRSFYRDGMDAPSPPSQEQIEAAVRQTLIGWGNELDEGQKFWWGDWCRLMRDVEAALRTGVAVDYGDDDET